MGWMSERSAGSLRGVLARLLRACRTHPAATLQGLTRAWRAVLGQLRDGSQGFALGIISCH